jgi:toxin ParE1/3/4
MTEPLDQALDAVRLLPPDGARTDDPTIRRMTTFPYPYLIFYEATDDEIIIHAVRHGARDPWPRIDLRI